jgi:hypothetical protein
MIQEYRSGSALASNNSPLSGSRFWRWLAAVALGVVAGLSDQPGYAYDVMLRWTVPPEPGIAGYRVYAGPASRAYGQPVDVGLMATATLGGLVYYLYQNLQLGAPSYIAVTAYNTAGIESDYSNELLFNFSTVTPPTADSGPNQTGSVGDLLTIGSAAAPGISYFWQQIAGPPAALSSRTTSSAQFTPATAGTYLFSLTAYDPHGVATRNWVTVAVIGSGSPAPTPPSTPAPALIRGNAKDPSQDKTGCQVEWLVANPNNAPDRFGLPNQNQICQDGEPTCDFGANSPGLCEFQVMVCLNNSDPHLAACIPNGIRRTSVLAPRRQQSRLPTVRDALAADAATLQDALHHLGDPRHPEAGYVNAPPLDATQQNLCSAPFAIDVPLTVRKTSSSPRPISLIVRSTDYSLPRQRANVSRLKLTCQPPANTP